MRFVTTTKNTWDDNDNESRSTTTATHPRTDFFMAFHGLWNESLRIRIEHDDNNAAHETIIRTIDDMNTVLAIYRRS